MRTEYIMVFITCATKKEAQEISGALLAKRLIACANIIPEIKSKFWWHAKIENTDEVMMVLKAKGKKFKDIESEVKRFHSYEVPEIIALPIVAGSKEYLKWIDEESY